MDFDTETISSVKTVKPFRNFNVDDVRADFPILKRLVNDKPLVYLDNAATSQKPNQVIDAITNYYRHENANIHRGLHFLSELATDAYEGARLKIKEFLNAMSVSEIIFVRGATEGINLLTNSLGNSGYFKDGDEIIISQMEHHSNIVPWQMLSEKKNLKLRVVPVNDKGEFIFEEFEKLISERTKIVSVVHISNALGTINPVKEIVKKAHEFNIPVLLDGAQAVPHTKVDVQDLDCDFYVFSGHKVFGPTGIGVLYGKTEYMDKLPPFQGGGDMIREVSFEKTTYDDLPQKFEAGTPNIVGGIALGAAIDYLTSFNRDEVDLHERELLNYATNKLSEIEGLKIIGTSEKKTSVVSFIIENIHPYDIGTIIDTDGIAIRTGHHCTMPLIKRFGLPATARASFSIYNKIEEIDKLYDALLKVKRMFS